MKYIYRMRVIVEFLEPFLAPSRAIKECVCICVMEKRENFHVIYANLCIKATEIGQDEMTEI
jgi:hypothetical protein